MIADAQLGKRGKEDFCNNPYPFLNSPLKKKQPKQEAIERTLKIFSKDAEV